ncbi:anti-sigma factor domain-containing protein [Nocardia sp. NPDC052566]|uniref:anti-sigma factor n=1 Tax=Nocardia sp. NPDC052566 TaxID=3364330 RepID=UPI0037CA485E
MTEPTGDELLDLAVPYALDAVTDTERDAIEVRLQAAEPEANAEFTDAVRDIHETMVAVTVFDSIAPPPEVEAAILRAIDESEPGTAQRFRRIPRRTRWLAAAAAVLAAIGIGVAVVVVRSTEHPASQLTAQQVLEQPDTRTLSEPIAGGGTMTVYTSAGLRAAAVSFASVPAPTAGRSYQLWLVPQTGSPRSAGVLADLPGSGAPVVTRFDPADALAMTIEPSGGSPQPTSTPIVVVKLG